MFLTADKSQHEQRVKDWQELLGAELAEKLIAEAHALIPEVRLEFAACRASKARPKTRTVAAGAA